MFTNNLIFGYADAEAFYNAPFFDTVDTFTQFVLSPEFKDWVSKSKNSRQIIMQTHSLIPAIKSKHMLDLNNSITCLCAKSISSDESTKMREIYRMLFEVMHGVLTDRIYDTFRNTPYIDFESVLICPALWLASQRMLDRMSACVDDIRCNTGLGAYLMQTLATAVADILHDEGYDYETTEIRCMMNKVSPTVLLEPLASNLHYSKLFPSIISNAITSIISPSSSTSDLCSLYYETYQTDKLKYMIAEKRSLTPFGNVKNYEFYTIYSAIVDYDDIDTSAEIIGSDIEFADPSSDEFVMLNNYKSYVSILELYRLSDLPDFKDPNVDSYIRKLEERSTFDKVIAAYHRDDSCSTYPVSESVDNLEDENDYSGPVLTQALTMLDKYSFDYIDATDITVTLASEASDYDKDERTSMKRRARSEKLQKGAAKVYHGYKKYNDEAQKIDSQVTGITKTLAKKVVGLEDDKIRDEVIEGKKITVFGVLKKILHTVAIFSVSKVAGVIAVVTHFYLGHKIKNSERKRVCMELENEIKMVDEKIEDARQDGNRQAKYNLMRTRNNLQIALNKIRSASRGAKRISTKGALKEANDAIKTSREG